jgi:hypothetical protein
VHTPAPLQTLGHLASGWFTPLASQTSGVASAPQLRSPGRHEPLHAAWAPPLLHKNGHTWVSRQICCESHSWITGAPGLQRVSPNLHPAVQVPLDGSHSGRSLAHGASSS